MIAKFFFFGLVLGVTAENKWIWNDSNRNGGRNVVRDEDLYERQDPSARYEVYEPSGPIDNYPSNSYNPVRPPPGEGYRPNPGIINNQRPGGLYGQSHLNGGYGPGQGNYYPNETPLPAILTGPVPSWQQEGPFKDFDTCKCTEKFNCQSPGISYGHCDVGKQYCCYSKKGKLGGPPPSRPVHSIENGILAGPGGPVDPIPGRPVSHRPLGNYHRPGSGGGFGLSGGGRPQFSGGNEVLVGPGGPYDRPYRRPFPRSGRED